MENILIRKATEADAEAIIKYLNIVGGESDNLLFGKNEFYMTVEEEQEFIKEFNGSLNSVMLLAKDNDAIVSVGSLSGFGRKRISHRGELAISVKKEYWNKGVGSAMLKELIQFGKEKAKLSVIQLTVKADNERAIHTYKKFGFKQIGYYEKFFLIDGKYFDACLMNLYLDQ
ncbi:GNAT family N-acetyltransferase [Anaerocolumna aminovalerica]|jgi:RimJ/RimL family protein N-acetyltransferase|uniref:Protein N-acetyltransferase, RimJ/RimL family n=1 Tax=Anaerocolumna aminovalerica TaxID=1527 RepID=A0A1I5ERA4_9FIRM|nr:GNAT family protein [Anaerocolumna aminovalerica]MDU6264217.1 GNAT family protein [Anaerocolumna aminovalerica]SFO13561.1 Protein N-acetyltransferase, RimJ/RimL family [Anaerocolumna aminovalerica]